MYAREEELEQRRRSKLGKAGGASGGILYNTQGKPVLASETKRKHIFFPDFSCTYGRTCMYASTATRFFTLDSV